VTVVLNEWRAMGAGASSTKYMLREGHKLEEKNKPMSPLQTLKHAVYVMLDKRRMHSEEY
jgi:hypothetical protein